MGAMPDGMIGPVASLCGRTLNRVLKGRRTVVAGNLDLAYGSDPARPQAADLSRAVLSSLCRSFLELTHLPRNLEQGKAMFVERNPGARAETLRIIREDGPVVFAASHFGAYETACLAAATMGISLSVLVRPLDNPRLERYLNGIRSRHGQRILSNRGGIAGLVRDLKSGRSAAILIDLNMHRRNAVFVDYFGVKAATAPTAALLAWRTGRPLVPVYIHRTATPMRFETELTDPIWPDRGSAKAEEVRRLLQEATSRLEARVRETPGEWLWTHRRFKTRPPREQEIV